MLNTAYIGKWSQSANYAIFSHKDSNNRTDYAVIQGLNAETRINSKTDLYLRTQDNGGNGIKLNDNGAVNFSGASLDFAGREIYSPDNYAVKMPRLHLTGWHGIGVHRGGGGNYQI